ncbi:MAG: alpha/beta hydrolase [Phycisphaeraceae bacterium]|nr:MAG: alpha/beta hydrolase [Phycisphaeraceae bacterium]
MSDALRSPAATLRTLGMALAAALALTAHAAAGPLGDLAHVETRGDGERHMILIPGLGQDWTVWEGFMSRNGERYTMHAVTLPGFGGSEAPKLPEDASRYAWMDNAVEAVTALIENAGLQDTVVMGHGSLGGFVAMRVGMERADLVEHIIAVDAMAPGLPLPGSATGVIPYQERLQLVEMLGPMFLQFDEDEWHNAVQNLDSHAIDADFGAKMQEISRKTPRSTGARYMVELMATDLSPLMREAMIEGDAKVFMIYAIGESEGPASMPRQSRRAKDISAQILEQSFGATVAIFNRSRPFIMHDHPGAFDGMIADYLEGEDVYDYFPPSPRRDE